MSFKLYFPNFTYSSKPYGCIDVSLYSRGLPGFVINDVEISIKKKFYSRLKDIFLKKNKKFPFCKIYLSISDFNDTNTECFEVCLAAIAYILYNRNQFECNEYFFTYKFDPDLNFTSTKYSLYNLYVANIFFKNVLGSFLNLPSVFEKCTNFEIYSLDNLDSTHVSSKPSFINIDSLSIFTYEKYIGLSSYAFYLYALCFGGFNISLFGPPGYGKNLFVEVISEFWFYKDINEHLKCLAYQELQGYEVKNYYKRPIYRIHPSKKFPKLDLNFYNSCYGHIIFIDELNLYSARDYEKIKELFDVASSRKFNFVVVVSFNPCPCGFFGIEGQICRCSGSEIKRYSGRIPNALKDRIDINIAITGTSTGLNHSCIQDNVILYNKIAEFHIDLFENYIFLVYDNANNLMSIFNTLSREEQSLLESIRFFKILSYRQKHSFIRFLLVYKILLKKSAFTDLDVFPVIEAYKGNINTNITQYLQSTNQM